MRKKKQSPIITLLILLLGGMLGYFFASQFGGSEIDSVVIDGGIISADVGGLSSHKYEDFEKMEFNFEVIDQERYRDLRVYGPEKVVPGAGRGDQIFNPY